MPCLVPKRSAWQSGSFGAYIPDQNLLCSFCSTQVMHNPHYGMLFICVDFISEDVVDSVTKWGHTALQVFTCDCVIECFYI